MKRGDRRASKRISYVCEVECEGAGLKGLATRITDLSLSGAFIDSLTCYSPGARLRLRFHIKDILIETTAEVRYTMPQMGMGVRFFALDAHQQTALENLIEGKPLVRRSANSGQLERSEDGPNGWNTTVGLFGNFAVVSMFDVIQIIENNRIGGALEVRSPSASGEIHFNDGQIAAAYSASRTGVDALKGFLDIIEGSFEFRKSASHFPSHINAPNNMSLILDLLRDIDEEAAALS